MAATKTVLGELGNCIVESSKKARDAGAKTAERDHWIEILAKASAAYAEISKATVSFPISKTVERRKPNCKLPKR